MDKRVWATERATWLASYPKSGNTWVRALLHAYRSGGYLNLNDISTAQGDANVTFTLGVSPIAMNDLGHAGQLQLRPAAILYALMARPVPRIMKTHFANLKPMGVPAYIPFEFTERAIYVVRDPRDVAVSFSKFFGLSTHKTCQAMADAEHWIGGDGQTIQILSSWSSHVASWIAEDRYPVHVVKYEDLMEDSEKELSAIIKFLGWDLDNDLVRKTVEACSLAKMKEQEDKYGFAENMRNDSRGTFFNGGGSRWEAELGRKWAAQIEEDHRAVMEQLGYLDKREAHIREVI